MTIAWAFDKEKDSNWKEYLKTKYSKYLWDGFSNLIFYGDTEYQSAPSRIIVFGYLFGLFIIGAVYSAEFTSRLTIERQNNKFTVKNIIGVNMATTETSSSIAMEYGGIPIARSWENMETFWKLKALVIDDEAKGIIVDEPLADWY